MKSLPFCKSQGLRKSDLLDDQTNAAQTRDFWRGLPAMPEQCVLNFRGFFKTGWEATLMHLDCADSSVSLGNCNSIYEQHKFLLHRRTGRVSSLGQSLVTKHILRGLLAEAGRGGKRVGRLNHVIQFSQIWDAREGSCSLQTDTSVSYWFCSF